MLTKLAYFLYLIYISNAKPKISIPIKQAKYTATSYVNIVFLKYVQKQEGQAKLNNKINNFYHHDISNIHTIFFLFPKLFPRHLYKWSHIIHFYDIRIEENKIIENMLLQSSKQNQLTSCKHTLVHYYIISILLSISLSIYLYIYLYKTILTRTLKLLKHDI